MPFITFFAKNKYVALCRLTRTMVLGRSLDCQIFVPDVFVSRQHCRFESTPAGWTAIDLGSANGICVDGLRVARHLMKEGDILEIGTIAIEFHEGQPGDVASSTAPFGAATPVSELVDTVFAQGLRPVDFSRQALRRDLWAVKVTGEEAAIIDEESPDLLPGRYPDEWVELDIEWQLADNTMYTVASLGSGWEWTDLDLDLEAFAALSAQAEHPEFATTPPWQLELDDDSADYLPVETASRPRQPVETRRGAMATTIDDAVRQYDESNKPEATAAPRIWRASGKAASLVEKVKDAFADLCDSDLVDGLRRSPRPWIGIAAAMAVAIYAGVWTTRRLNRPPVQLSDGKPNPAYFNGDSHD